MSRIYFVLVLIALLALSAVGQKKLRVYILAGQSNMQGHAKVETFDYLDDDPATRPLLKTMRDRKGRPTVAKKVWISYLTQGRGAEGTAHGKLSAGWGARRDPARDGGKIGPEFTFGLRMAEAYDGPILIIKTAWGGKSLHTDFRPPSAGPYVFNERELERMKKRGVDIEAERKKRAQATGVYYRKMIAHIKSVLDDPKAVVPGYSRRRGFELAGFVWFQGWNDMVDSGVYPQRDRSGGYAAYSEVFSHFIRDVRRDLKAPKMPVVIGVMGVSGPIAKEDEKRRRVHRHFREAMTEPATRKEFRGNVIAVPTAVYWDETLDRISKKHDQVRQMGHRLRTKHKDGPNADGSMTPKEQRAYVDRYRDELLGDDAKIWARGASNAAYHYLGSAKIIGQIGRAFAEALIDPGHEPRER